MKIIRDIDEMKNFSSQYRKENAQKKISFVPTMGFLHRGHISLMQKAKRESDLLVVSIFVNPTQFDNPQDLQKYPRAESQDIEICKTQQVDVLFLPAAEQVYPQKSAANYADQKIFIDYPSLTAQLCGKFRTGHFSGMLWIVHNLFVWVQPHLAFLGLKDFQQFMLVRQMVFDLALPIKIYGGKLIREENGLALSSRNSRLSPQGKILALQISRSLFEMQEKIEKQKLCCAQEIIPTWKDMLGDLHVEYAGVYHPLTLQPFAENETVLNSPHGYLLAMAAYVEDVRLIDNLLGGNIPFPVV